ncbi:hypothetical protein LIPSTDRAFT_76829, partial [Lipomyces starkeyi NRRL Y-11557]
MCEADIEVQYGRKVELGGLVGEEIGGSGAGRRHKAKIGGKRKEKRAGVRERII